MLASALPFSLYLRGVRSALRNLIRDQQVRTFFLLIILFYGAFVLLLKLGGGPSADSSWLWILFNTVSILTTTGLRRERLQQLGTDGSHAVLLCPVHRRVLRLTSGSMKVFRLQLGFAVLANQLRRLVHPRGSSRYALTGVEYPRKSFIP